MLDYGSFYLVKYLLDKFCEWFKKKCKYFSSKRTAIEIIIIFLHRFSGNVSEKCIKK